MSLVQGLVFPEILSGIRLLLLLLLLGEALLREALLREASLGKELLEMLVLNLELVEEL